MVTNISGHNILSLASTVFKFLKPVQLDSIFISKLTYIYVSEVGGRRMTKMVTVSFE